jgi:hypothetical protein
MIKSLKPWPLTAIVVFSVLYVVPVLTTTAKIIERSPNIMNKHALLSLPLPVLIIVAGILLFLRQRWTLYLYGAIATIVTITTIFFSPIRLWFYWLFSGNITSGQMIGLSVMTVQGVILIIIWWVIFYVVYRYSNILEPNKSLKEETPETGTH